MDSGRIIKELKELQLEAKKNPNATVSAQTVNDDIRHWKGTIFGPSDTCYEGGIFVIDINIP